MEFSDANIGVERYLAKPGDFITNQTQSGIESVNLEYEVLLYDSIKHLYYSNYISGSNGYTSNVNKVQLNVDGTLVPPSESSQTYQPSYYNYEETTLNSQKYFTGNNIGIISIPSKLYGDNIKPNSIILESVVSGTLYDDGEGRMYQISGSGRLYIGNVMYQHGLIIINQSSGSLDPYLTAFIQNEVTMSFSSSYTIYETQYKVTIDADKYNYTTNPTLISSSQGDVYDFATGSAFSPYITTVGLYDDDYNLLAVAKLAQPLKTSKKVDTTILINIDR